MAKTDLAIVIPAYNEEFTIGDTVSNVSNFGTPVVVNDCSTDQTENIAISAGAIVINHACNRGYDGALNTGFNYASKRGFKYVITFDADGQHPAEYVGVFLDLLESGAEIVLGVRSRMPRFGESIFAALLKFKYGIPDPLCGMKGYNMNLYVQQGYFDSYQSIGTELMLFALNADVNVRTISIPIVERKGCPRFGRRLSANLKILRAMWKGMLWTLRNRKM